MNFGLDMNIDENIFKRLIAFQAKFEWARNSSSSS